METKTKSVVSAASMGASANMSMSLTVISLVDKAHEQLMTAIDDMDELVGKETEKRSSYSFQGRRIVAVEKGKRQITLHLPKTIVDCKTNLKKTFDKRGFGYVRIRNPDQVPEALRIIQWAFTKGKAPKVDDKEVEA